MTRLNKFCRIRIVSADVPNLLSEISLSGVEVLSIEQLDLLTINVSIESKYMKRVEKIFSKNDANWKIIEREGGLWKAGLMWRRPVLMIGIILFFIVAIVVPNLVIFVDVTGNQAITTQEIIANAESVGIKFGALATDIRSEAVKNKLLQSMPRLQWVGITTRGSVAEIQIKERSIKQIEASKADTVSSIVAVCDGVITDQMVYEGNPLFQVGDAVNKGDTLVSGYVDCGIKLKAGRANAEIYAFTTRENKFISPHPSVVRRQLEEIHTCYKLRIGKKVINLCNHSGIMDTGCVKMYSEDYWSFPGGFRLPVSVISITHKTYGVGQLVPGYSSCTWLPQFAREYLASHMLSGRILNEKLQQEALEDVDVLTGIYACHEMIGREKYEGINK